MIGSESYLSMNQHSTISNVKVKQKYGVQKLINDGTVVWKLQPRVVRAVLDFSVSSHGEERVVFRIYNENTESDARCDILDNYLVPTVQLYGLEDNCFFQHDND